MGDITLETVKLLAETLTPMIRDGLRQEFHQIRNAFQEANSELRQEFDRQTGALRVLHERDMKELKALHEAGMEELRRRVAELETTKWHVALSYGAVVAAVTAAYHLVTKIGWPRIMSILGKGPNA